MRTEADCYILSGTYSGGCVFRDGDCFNTYIEKENVIDGFCTESFECMCQKCT